MAGVDGAGATAVVAILDGRQATLANIGDSGAAAVYADKDDGRLVGQMLTVAHKPHVEAEQRRIVSAGGAVQQVRGARRVVLRELLGSKRGLCKTVATVTAVLICAGARDMAGGAGGTVGVTHARQRRNQIPGTLPNRNLRYQRPRTAVRYYRTTVAPGSSSRGASYMYACRCQDSNGGVSHMCRCQRTRIAVRWRLGTRSCWYSGPTATMRYVI